jgi:hypothetical protein
MSRNSSKQSRTRADVKRNLGPPSESERKPQASTVPRRGPSGRLRGQRPVSTIKSKNVLATFNRAASKLLQCCVAG